MLQEASKHVMPKFIAGNLAHFARLQRVHPVASMVLEMDENDDNYPNLSCELMHVYPGYALGTYSAMLVLSVRQRVDPADIMETLKIARDSSVSALAIRIFRPLLPEQLCGSILWKFPRHDHLNQSKKQQQGIMCI